MKKARNTIAQVFAQDRARYERGTRGWASGSSFAQTEYSRDVLAKIRARWQVQRLVEYRSTSVFLDLGKQLMEAGAALEAAAVVARMAQDEYRHADLCAEVARGLGATTLAPLSQELPRVARHGDVSRQIAALRNVILCTCISETNAVANFTVELEHITDPFVRAATRTLLADEVLHGEFGFRFLTDWTEFLAADASARAEITRYLRFAFAYAERELLGSPDAHRATAEELSLGLLDRSTRRDIFMDVVRHAIIPGLEQFGLGAETAFRTRTLS